MNLLISTDILEWIELHVGMRDQLSLLDGKSSCYFPFPSAVVSHNLYHMVSTLLALVLLPLVLEIINVL